VISLLVPVVAVIWAFTMPVEVPQRAGIPPACTYSVALPNPTVVWVSFTADRDTVPQFYNLGWLAPGTKFSPWFVTRGPTWGAVQMTFGCPAPQGVVYTCRKPLPPVYPKQLPAFPGDFNGDGVIDVTDVAIFSGLMGQPPPVYRAAPPDTALTKAP
jgi:hypothetical protein